MTTTHICPLGEKFIALKFVHLVSGRVYSVHSLTLCSFDCRLWSFFPLSSCFTKVLEEDEGEERPPKTTVGSSLKWFYIWCTLTHSLYF